MSPDILDGILGSSATAVRTLLEHKVIARQSVVLNSAESEIEYVFECKFGPMESRAEPIARLIQSRLLARIELGNAKDVWGYGIFGNENLKDIGVIRAEHGKTIIDFSEMASRVKSPSAVIHITQPFPREIMDTLLILNIGKAPRITKDKIAAPLEIMLDNGSFWQELFGSLSVRDINFTYTLRFPPDLLTGYLPRPFVDKVKRIRKRLIGGDESAIAFFGLVSKEFLKYQSPEIVDLRSLASTDPGSRFEIVDVRPNLESVNISGTEFPVTLPTSMTFKVNARIEGPEVFAHGTLTLDLAGLRSLIRTTTESIERQSSPLVD